jgi:hypothetical protein
MTEPQHDAPKGLKATMNHPEKDAIIEVMKKELQEFKALNTIHPSGKHRRDGGGGKRGRGLFGPLDVCIPRISPACG